MIPPRFQSAGAVPKGWERQASSVKEDILVSKYVRFLLVILMLLSLLVLVPSGSKAEILTLPLEERADIPKPLESGYQQFVNPETGRTEWTYEDPSISVHITTGVRELLDEEKGKIVPTTYYVATVKIANASQIRTTFATNFYAQDGKVNATNIAKRQKAVLAINGDFYSNPRRADIGYVCRQGIVYRVFSTLFINGENQRCHFDVLVIDENGDFHIEQNAEREDLLHLPYTPINGFTFGPALIINGEKVQEFFNTDYGPNAYARRMCIAQTGPLEYMCVCCDGKEDGCKGLTITELTDLVYELGEGRIQTAYNLDGGGSTHMIFHEKLLNTPGANGARQIDDMIYFGSAYLPD